MAARQNQGHLIAIILLSLLCVIFGVCTFMGFSGSAANANLKAQADEELKKARDRGNALQDYVSLLKGMIGIDGTPAQNQDLVNAIRGKNIADLTADVDKAMGFYQQDMLRVQSPEKKDLTYKLLVEDFTAAITDQHNRIASIESQKDLLVTEAEATKNKHTEEVSALNAALAESQVKLKAQQDLAAEQQQKLNSQLEEVKSQVVILTNQLRAEQQGRETQVTELNNSIDGLTKDKIALTQQIRDLTRVNTDIADGRITAVSPTTDTVYINLGAADGLRAKQRFVVYDRSETIYEKYLGKAFIEITEVQGPHRAQARVIPAPNVDDVLESINLDLESRLITEDQASNTRIQFLNSRKSANPILTGDYILSDVWDPGYSVSVALIGNLDVDGDGISDLALVESKIEQNGGQVVAKHDSAGNKSGEINIQTRYVVVGDSPPPEQSAAAAVYADMLRSAERFNVQKISVRELYNALGFQGEAVTEHMGRRIGTKFQPRYPAPARPAEDSAFENQ
jgi:hypothetical protein